MYSHLLSRTEAMRFEKYGWAVAAKPALYTMILLLSVAGAFAYKLRSEGIFACPADGYASNHFLAYCHASAYGDYDRGAFWFGLEPEARRAAAGAEVLFIGSSRMQFAFSSAAASDWFRARGVPYYLLGFTHNENAVFATPLISALKPKAKVYIINVDRFFDDVQTPPTRAVLAAGDARSRYAEKEFWQSVHRRVCAAVPAVCGTHFAYFRRRDTGAWQQKGWSSDFESKPAADGPQIDIDRWKHFSEIAKSFVSALPVDRQCVILTIVPSESTKRAEASAIAQSLGQDLVAPQLDGLLTFDRNHLDQASAERWSRAFFEAAGPRIRECLDRQRMSS
jgi:hypothetical protein